MSTMTLFPDHTWVALGHHAQMLMPVDQSRVLAILFWQPDSTIDNVTTGDPEVEPATYVLMPIGDPHAYLGIEYGPMPTRADWPEQLLSEATRHYLERWGI